jgi:hypothetical protein
MDTISRSLTGSISARTKSQILKTKVDELMKNLESSKQTDRLESIATHVWTLVANSSAPDPEDNSSSQNVDGLIDDINLFENASSPDLIHSTIMESDHMLWSPALEDTGDTSLANFDIDFQLTDLLDLY